MRPLAAGLVLLSCAGPGVVSAEAVHPSGLAWRSGYEAPGQDDEGQISGFERWRGRASDVTLIFVGRDFFEAGDLRPSRALRPNGMLESLTGRGRRVALSLPLLVDAERDGFSDCAGGAVDEPHRLAARRVAEIVGETPIYIRLGWEANHGQPWSFQPVGVDGAADYRRCWGRLASIYKTEIVSASMVWNNLKDHKLPIAEFYPGDDVVDVVGVDAYDNGKGLRSGFVVDEAAWARFLGAWDPGTGFADGIAGHLAFAKARGKPLSVDEWGASNEPRSADHGSNNGFYVTAMYRWFAAHAADIAFECYFGGAKGRHTIFPPVDYLVEASNAYRAAWRPDEAIMLMATEPDD